MSDDSWLHAAFGYPGPVSSENGPALALQSMTTRADAVPQPQVSTVDVQRHVNLVRTRSLPEETWSSETVAQQSPFLSSQDTPHGIHQTGDPSFSAPPVLINVPLASIPVRSPRGFHLGDDKTIRYPYGSFQPLHPIATLPGNLESLHRDNPPFSISQSRNGEPWQYRQNDHKALLSPIDEVDSVPGITPTDTGGSYDGFSSCINESTYDEGRVTPLRPQSMSSDDSKNFEELNPEDPKLLEKIKAGVQDAKYDGEKSTWFNILQ